MFRAHSGAAQWLLLITEDYWLTFSSEQTFLIGERYQPVPRLLYTVRETNNARLWIHPQHMSYWIFLHYTILLLPFNNMIRKSQWKHTRGKTCSQTETLRHLRYYGDLAVLQETLVTQKILALHSTALVKAETCLWGVDLVFVRYSKGKLVSKHAHEENKADVNQTAYGQIKWSI